MANRICDEMQFQCFELNLQCGKSILKVIVLERESHRFSCEFWYILGLKMESEMFSLEDDNYGNMFITQESSKSEILLDELDESDEDSNLFCDVRENDFQSPVVSKVNVIRNPMYRSGMVNSKSFIGKVCFELSGNLN